MKTIDDQYHDSQGSADSQNAAGAGWQRFFEGFHDSVWCHDDALEAICALLEEARGIECKYCGSDHTQRKYGCRYRACSNCNRRYSVTAGTYFHNVRKPLGWLRIIRQFDRGIICSKAELTRMTSIAYSSVSTIFNKLTKTILDNMMDDGCVVLDSALFLSIFGKRSIDTPAKHPPSSEQSEYEAIHAQNNIETAPANLEELEIIPAARYVYELLREKPLSSDEIVSTAVIGHGDVLAGLMMLELCGMVGRDKHGRMQLKGPRVCAAATSPDSVQLSVAESIELSQRILSFINDHFHAISRKYLQLYLAQHWWHQHPNLWKQKTISRLCANAAYFRGKDFLHYVSGLFVKAAGPAQGSVRVST